MTAWSVGFGMPVAALWALLAGPPPAVESGKGTVVLRLDCRSTIGRREITLFANGTVRLRDGVPGKEKMSLAELGAAERDAFLRRLEGIDLHEAASTSDSASGDWIERCVLELKLAGRAERSFTFSRYDSLGLGVDQLRRLAVELGEGVDPRGRDDRLPRGYRPAVGDCLRRVDGAVYRVHGMTSDGKGVELEGVSTPLTIYLPLGQLDGEFSAKVECRR